MFDNYTANIDFSAEQHRVFKAKPFDLRRERKAWWKCMRYNGPLSKQQIDEECPRTIKKYEKYGVGLMEPLYWTEESLERTRLIGEDLHKNLFGAFSAELLTC